MINHGRTLLLNEDGDKRPGAEFFLEEYVDPAFKALSLPGYLAGVRAALLSAGDDAWQNYRLQQLMALLHGTEFVSYLLALDPRFTYRHDRSILDLAYGGSSSPMNVQAMGLQPIYSGSLTAGISSPRISYGWTVEVLSPTLVNSTDRLTGYSSDSPVTYQSGLSSVILLAGQSKFGIRFQSASLPTGARLEVSYLVRPDSELTDLLAPLESLGDEVVSSLFGTAEPYKTFKQLWEKHGYTAYRFSGLLLAYVYRAEEVRLGG
jgi:hypothetical protein